ncbi:MAG: MarR family transcriptional regulator [Magnetococcus sp. YQC-9]
MSIFVQNIVNEHRENWPEEFDPLALPYAVTFHRAHGLMYGRQCAAMATFDLTPAEFDVLASLRRSSPPHELTPSQLRHALLITSGGLTKVLHQLTARGLIERPVGSGDRRVKPVRLAKPAYPLIDRAMREVMQQTRQRLVKFLTVEEIRDLTALLTKLTEEE